MFVFSLRYYHLCSSTVFCQALSSVIIEIGVSLAVDCILVIITPVSGVFKKLIIV